MTRPHATVFCILRVLVTCWIKARVGMEVQACMWPLLALTLSAPTERKARCDDSCPV
eukprot:CAMPEP_0119388380 /NCGR_PEP_ID=MMETSP1334-20130426/104713_1 /TAXON_ID=127549 /ORGANISM="Calcidiscus leptoporus, Strain RCC1130" /LENGTH=56 /DNA_ID=CAMNT_0007410345 /DNA_START=30 /DNA_END=200 /DNA_ORIENTATION=-